MGLIPAVKVEIFNAGRGATAPGVVEEDIQPAIGVDRQFNSRLDLGRLGDVTKREGDGAGKALRQFAPHLSLQVGCDHLGTFGDKQLQGGQTNARAGPGDDCNFVF